MNTRYVKLIADISNEERELWSQLAFNLRDPNRTSKMPDWVSWFRVNTYLYVVIDPDNKTHSYTASRNQNYITKAQTLTLEILQTLNLLKLTGG